MAAAGISRMPVSPAVEQPRRRVAAAPPRSPASTTSSQTACSRARSTSADESVRSVTGPSAGTIRSACSSSMQNQSAR